MLLWLEFVLCSVLIFISSHYISKCGQSLARKMNWQEGFVGVLFLAAATSLPETFTGISSVAINRINLGVGDAIGSLIINMMLIGVLDYFQGRGRILLHAKKENVLTASSTAVLLAILVLFTFLRQNGLFGFYFLGIGLESFIIIGLYLWGMRTIFKKSRIFGENNSKVQGASHVWIKFIAFFIVIVLLGLWLVNIGKRISDVTQLNQSFIGALLLAFSTSLPELAVSTAALRLGSIDMAIANILGSNFFDVCIVPLMDTIYREGPLLGSIAPINIFTMLLALVMTGVVIAGLLVRQRDTRMKLTWDTGLLLVLGIAGYFVIYRFG
ncbi:MAG: sodium:calcium antiporter [Candidatus Omnitrophica bacterium]|nr:sodium:calcium antiporter [Candidatus Omnitrophota bacterium]